MDRSASAVWHGSLKEGKGIISTQSGVLKEAQYSFGTRFENGIGTNPEELIAAAHAGCFTMALSGQLTSADLVPESLETTAVVTMEKNGRRSHGDEDSPGDQGQGAECGEGKVRRVGEKGEGRMSYLTVAESSGDHAGRTAGVTPAKTKGLSREALRVCERMSAVRCCGRGRRSAAGWSGGGSRGVRTGAASTSPATVA